VRNKVTFFLVLASVPVVASAATGSLNDFGRVALLIVFPFYMTRLLDEEWTNTAPDASRQCGRRWSLWGAGLAIIGAGFTNLGNPISEQIAAEVFMSFFGFSLGYVLGWVSSKL